MELNEDDDFGFSAVTEDELKELERETIQILQSKQSQSTVMAETYQQKMDNLYKAIMPLLNNLKKDPEKEYIYWPNRQDKLDAFIAKLNAIVK